MKDKRDRSKPKHDALKRALDAVLADKEQLSLLAVASIDSDHPGAWWDEDGPYFDDPADWDAQIKGMEDRLRDLQSLLARIPSKPKRRGGQNNPALDLNTIDNDILKLAQQYAARTGKPAANGAQGQNINNQGGPFVREAAAKLNVTERAIINRIDRFEKHPRLKSLWDSWRTPLGKRFGPALEKLLEQSKTP